MLGKIINYKEIIGKQNLIGWEKPFKREGYCFRVPRLNKKVRIIPEQNVCFYCCIDYCEEH